MAEDVKFQYVWYVRYVDTPALRDENKDPGTDNDCTEAGDERLYYVSDAQMNVTALVDGATGEVVERYMYDPYGKATVCEEDWTPREDNASAVANDVLYCGYRFDNETGLYHVRYRYYHPTLGRWIQRDPAGYADGLSLYEDVMSSPTCYVDYSGLQLTLPPGPTNILPKKSTQPVPGPTSTTSQPGSEEEREWKEYKKQNPNKWWTAGDEYYDERQAFWDEESQNLWSTFRNQGVAGRVQYVAHALAECSKTWKFSDAFENFLTALQGEPGGRFAQGGYAGGAGWKNRQTGALTVAGTPWVPGGFQLQLPPNYGATGTPLASGLARNLMENSGALAAAKACLGASTPDPTGLNQLATIMTWEVAHWGLSGVYQVPANTTLMKEMWQQMDCCCIQTYLKQQK